MPSVFPLVVSPDARDADKAVSLDIVSRWPFELAEQASGLAMSLVDGKLSLVDFEDPKTGGVFVDFLSGESLYRKQHGGGKKEPIAKAIGVKGEATPKVLDATPGLGRDAFVLASLGCHVTMVERSPVVAALLEDGLRRLAVAAPELHSQFSLVHGNSSEVMKHWQGDDIDVIYLDPMFPHRKKSALVKKEMRLFQQLLGPDEDADDLLEPARALANKRVVVKRPNAADVLAGVQPSMAITSKKHRFDVYIIS